MKGADPSRKTLVLCDGIGCDGFIWPYIVDGFCEDNNIVRWHYRGHGRSSRPSDLERLSIQDLTDDLAGILDELDAGPVVLLGHSMGVQVILEYYLRHPEHVQALVPICGSPGRPLDTFKGTSRWLPVFDRVIQVVKSNPELTQTLWSTFLPTKLSLFVARHTEVNRQLINDADFWPYLEHIGNMDAEIFFRMLEHAVVHDTKDSLDSIDVPVLIAAGDRDGFTPVSCSQEMADLLPQSDLLVLEGGSHTAPLELPELIESHLLRFLEALPAISEPEVERAAVQAG